ncbi:MAG: helix-turn-helix domain-containing protein [Anaerolineae bacterium]
MSHITYTPSEKTAALLQLERLGGNVVLASRQLGIPERTLYTWRRRFYAENKRQHPPLPLPPTDLPDLEDDLQVLTYLRRQIMSEVLRLSTSFVDEAAFTTPQQRVTILTQLVDRLLKLNSHLHTHPRTYEDEEIEMEHPIKKSSEEEWEAQYGTQEDDIRHNAESLQRHNDLLSDR